MTNSMDDYEAIHRRMKEMGLDTDPGKEKSVEEGVIHNKIRVGDNGWLTVRCRCECDKWYLESEARDNISEGSLEYIRRRIIWTCEHFNWEYADGYYEAPCCKNKVRKRRKR